MFLKFKLDPSIDPLEINNESNVQLKELKRIEREAIFVSFLLGVAAGVISGSVIVYDKEIYVIAKNAVGKIVAVGNILFISILILYIIPLIILFTC